MLALGEATKETRLDADGAPFSLPVVSTELDREDLTGESRTLIDTSRDEDGGSMLAAAALHRVHG